MNIDIRPMGRCRTCYRIFRAPLYGMQWTTDCAQCSEAGPDRRASDATSHRRNRRRRPDETAREERRKRAIGITRAPRLARPGEVAIAQAVLAAIAASLPLADVVSR